jgi:hypothetical protein
MTSQRDEASPTGIDRLIPSFARLDETLAEPADATPEPSKTA